MCGMNRLDRRWRRRGEGEAAAASAEQLVSVSISGAFVLLSSCPFLQPRTAVALKAASFCVVVFVLGVSGGLGY